MKKYFEKLAVRLVISFSVVVAIVLLIMGYVLYKGITLNFENLTKENMVNTAKAAAQLIDIEKHEKLVSIGDMKSPAYVSEKEKLQKLQKEIGVKYIYTLRKNDNKTTFVIDAAESDAAEIGKEYDMLPAMEQAFSGVAQADKEFYTDEWGVFLSSYAPIKNASGTVVAIVGVDVEAKDILSMRSMIRMQLIIMFSLFTLIITGAIWMIARRITKPINIVTDRMVETARNGGDLTQRIKITTNTEVGKLAQAFNQLFAMIHDIMVKVKETAGQLSVATEELSGALTETSESMGRISRDATTLTEGIDQAGILFTNIKEEIGILSNNSSRIANGSEELDRHAQSTKDTAMTASDAVKNSTRSIAQLASMTQEASVNISALGEFTQSIAGIVETISGIARQTNLLALNAMIEAQRAGEAGRGFAVVAENIRVLSDNTQKSVDEIRRLVGDVVSRIDLVLGTQKAIDPVLKLTLSEAETVDNSLDHMLKQYIVMVDMIRHIAGSNEEQASAIQKLVSFTDEVSLHFMRQVEVAHSTTAATQEVNSMTEEIESNAHAISQTAEELKELIKKFRL